MSKHSGSSGASQAGHEDADSFAFIARELIENLQILNARAAPQRTREGLTPSEFAIAAVLCCLGRLMMKEQDASLAFEAGRLQGDKIREQERTRQDRYTHGERSNRMDSGKRIKASMKRARQRELDRHTERRRRGDAKPIRIEVSPYRLRQVLGLSSSYSVDRVIEAIERLSEIDITVDGRSFPPLVEKGKSVETSRGVVFVLRLNYGWFDHAPYRTGKSWVRVRFPLPKTHIALRLLLYLLRINVSRNRGGTPISKMKQILGFPAEMTKSQFIQYLKKAESSVNASLPEKYREYSHEVVKLGGQEFVRFKGGGKSRIRLTKEQRKDLDNQIKAAEEARKLANLLSSKDALTRREEKALSRLMG